KWFTDISGAYFEDLRLSMAWHLPELCPSLLMDSRAMTLELCWDKIVIDVYLEDLLTKPSTSMSDTKLFIPAVRLSVEPGTLRYAKSRHAVGWISGLHAGKVDAQVRLL